MAVSGTTAHYGLTKPVFRGSFWHEAMWNDLDQIDALLFTIAGNLDFVINNWENSHLYVETDRVVDQVDASSWQCVVGHTSGASPQTMAQYRAAHPTHWVSLSNTIAVRGAWAQGTIYNVNDIAYDTSEHVYGIAIADHTSTAIGTMRTDAVSWAFIADLDPFLVAAAASEAAAAASAAAAAASVSSLNGVLTTHGDLIYRNATVATRLPIGTANQILTSQGAGQNPTWSYGPAEVLLIKGTTGAAATHDFALDAYFGQGFESFRLVIHSIKNSDDVVANTMRVSTDSGATFLSTGAYDYTDTAVYDGFAVNAGYTGQAQFTMWGGLIGNAAAESGSAEITIYNPAEAAHYGKIMWRHIAFDAVNDCSVGFGGAQVNTPGDITDIRILVSSGTTVIKYSLYGMR